VSVEQSRQLGMAVMAASVLSLLLTLIGALRRSYLALAIPVTIGVGILAGLGFWVGYTMAATRWDEAVHDFEAAEGAPPPDSLG
jgi:xanthine/uracil/vitamin C permease (AzgA family)